MATTLSIGYASAPVTAGSGDRTLYLYHTHTHETGRFTFKHNGQYDQNVLKQLNVFLADWRTKEPTRMAPELFDLLWETYQDVGGSQPINIVSAYRTPVTNAMLRAKSSGVAENSQHMLGKAMDVFIPGVSLTKLREATMRHQVGGVGYYPTSGSPFVHVDVGSVRAWPRMTRAQLKKVFPDGKTLHLPTDGVPLSDSGRQYAMAQWSKCHTVPCNGSAIPAYDSGASVQLASLDPTQRRVGTIAIVAPVPMARPDDFSGASVAALAPIPASKSSTLMLATRGALPLGTSQSALTALADLGAPVPKARQLMTPETGDVMTAYAPDILPNAGAQRALQMLIERETTGSLPAGKAPAMRPSLNEADIRTASLGGTTGLNAAKGIFDLTWSAVSRAGVKTPMASALADFALGRHPVTGFETPRFELVAPEIDHVNETLVTPVMMSSLHFAEFYEPEGYIDHTAELGALANRIDFESDLEAPPGYDRFVARAPMLVASIN